MTILINNVVLVGRLTKDPDLRYTAVYGSRNIYFGCES